MVADVATGKAQQFWHNQPNDRVFNAINSIAWAGDHVVFSAQVPNDEWDRYYSVSIAIRRREPVLLTTTDGSDQRRRRRSHVRDDGRSRATARRCSTARTPRTSRSGTSGPCRRPAARRCRSRRTTASKSRRRRSRPARARRAVLRTRKQPASIGIVPVAGGDTKVVFPTAAMLKDFPQDAHVAPEIVITHAADGMEVHNQLFLPKDLKPGEKRPAIVFVHGGPARQMLPAYHYMQFYHWAYAYNQWLQSQGYIVMSVNYRSGIGYGNSFRRAPNTEGRGNSEYQDVVAGAKYLQGRADVDPARVGIWGLSYGGLLTAEALARNSDIFVAGVDLAGVHIYGNALDTTSLAFQSSAVGAIDGWKSPVFLEQGDDDRNVDFSQMVGLVDLLRAHGVYYELTVIPDDVHESLIHSRWIDIFSRSSDFLHRFVWDKQTPPAMTTNGKVTDRQRTSWPASTAGWLVAWSIATTILVLQKTKQALLPAKQTPVLWGAEVAVDRRRRSSCGPDGGATRTGRASKRELDTLANNFYEPRREALINGGAMVAGVLVSLWWATRDVGRRARGNASRRAGARTARLRGRGARRRADRRRDRRRDRPRRRPCLGDASSAASTRSPSAAMPDLLIRIKKKTRRLGGAHLHARRRHA